MPGAKQTDLNLGQKIDVALVLLAPLGVFVFIIALIVLCDRFWQHAQFFQTLRQEGRQAQAVVERIDQDEALAYVRYSSDGEERIGLLYARRDRDVLADLKPGDAVEVRYLPENQTAEVVREDHLDSLAGRWRPGLDVLCMLALGWLLAVWHPEILYVGFGDEGWWSPARKRA